MYMPVETYLQFLLELYFKDLLLLFTLAVGNAFSESDNGGII